MRAYRVTPLLAVVFAILLTATTAAANPSCTGVTVSSTQTGWPAIALAGSSVFVAWRDFRAADGDIYAQSLDVLGTPQWVSNGVGVAVQPNAQESASVISDGAGGAFVVWADYRDSEGAADIYGQRLDGAGASAWTPGGVNLSNLPFDSNAPVLVSDGAGGVIVVWLDQLGQWPSGGAEDIYAMRVDASGSQVWSAAHYKGICVQAAHQGAQQAVSDGAGGAIVVWRDRRAGNLDIYAARVTATGTRPWTANGVPVCTATGDQNEPQLVADGAGGVIIVWQDARSGNDDIYVQRVDGSGVSMWTADGVPISTVTGNQSRPRIAIDGFGGAVLAWEHTNDVYAQRIDGAGASVWTTGGVPVAVAANTQLAPRIAPDMSGGAYVVWADDRTQLYNEDLYGQHIDAIGTPTWDTHGSLLCTLAEDGMVELSADDAGGAALVWRAEEDQYLRAARLTTADPTGVADTPAASHLHMLSNVPNPFTGATEFRVYLDRSSPVVVDVYDVSGRRVARHDIGVAEAGWHSFVVNDRDLNGRSLPSGVYFCRVQAGSSTTTGKMVIAR